MKSTPTPPASYRQIAEKSIGSIITATLSEAGHAALVRLTTACSYIEADTNIACVEIKKALDSVEWRKLADESLKHLGGKAKHHREKLLTAFQIEKRNALDFWKGFDAVIHQTASLPPFELADLTEIAGVYDQPELDTDVNAQLVILIQLWCPQMAPDMKRKFAKQIERTLEMQRKLTS